MSPPPPCHPLSYLGLFIFQESGTAGALEFSLPFSTLVLRALCAPGKNIVFLHQSTAKPYRQREGWATPR